MLAHRPGMTGRAPVAVHLHAQYRAMLLDPTARGDEVAAVHAPSDSSSPPAAFIPDSGQAWVRLALALIIGSIRSVGQWSGGGGVAGGAGGVGAAPGRR